MIMCGRDDCMFTNRIFQRLAWGTITGRVHVQRTSDAFQLGNGPSYLPTQPIVHRWPLSLRTAIISPECTANSGKSPGIRHAQIAGAGLGRSSPPHSRLARERHDFHFWGGAPSAIAAAQTVHMERCLAAAHASSVQGLWKIG